VDSGTINQTGGFVSFAATLMADEPGKTGEGTIATITFKIIKAPSTGQNISCTLELADVLLADPSALAIPQDQYDVLNGNYLFFIPAGPQPEKPLIFVDPKDNIFYTTSTPVATLLLVLRLLIGRLPASTATSSSCITITQCWKLSQPRFLRITGLSQN